MAGASRVDIQGLVEDWAWNRFNTKASRKEKKLMTASLIMMETDWKRVRFVHGDPDYNPNPPKPGSGKPMNNTLFSTNFTNKTAHPQTFSFKTERTTRSACTVEIEQGYTKGVEAGIKLATPGDIFEANLGFSREISLTNIEGQTVEEELTWGVDSQIQVKGRHRAEAQLIIIEEEYKGKFTMKTHIKGPVRVVFTNLKDNNSFIRAVEGDMYEIIRAALDRKGLHGDVIYVDGDTRSVVCKTQGNCNFKYGLKQNVEVDQLPID